MAEVQQADGQSPRPPAAATPLAARTTRLYAADWAGFVRWCRIRNLQLLLAAPATIAAYLAEGPVRLSTGTLARRLSAIAGRHCKAGLALPTPDPAIKSMRETRRSATPRRNLRRRLLKPALAEISRAAVSYSNLKGVSDRGHPGPSLSEAHVNDAKDNLALSLTGSLVAPLPQRRGCRPLRPLRCR